MLPKNQNFGRFVIGSVLLRLARVVPFTSWVQQVCAQAVVVAAEARVIARAPEVLIF